MAGLNVRGHGPHDIDCREWFLQVIHGAKLHRFEVAAYIMVSGHYDHWTVAVPGYGALQDHLAMEIRPALADNHAFEAHGFHETYRLWKICTGCHIKAAVVEHPTIVVEVSKVLIDKENSGPAEERSRQVFLCSGHQHFLPLSGCCWVCHFRSLRNTRPLLNGVDRLRELCKVYQENLTIYAQPQVNTMKRTDANLRRHVCLGRTAVVPSRVRDEC